jgi:hypothetical protein
LRQKDVNLTGKTHHLRNQCGYHPDQTAHLGSYQKCL